MFVHDLIAVNSLHLYSTPMTDEHACSKLVHLTDPETHEPLFHVSYEPAACKECIAAHTADNCWHMLEPVPDHINTDNVLQKAFMGEDEYAQEVNAEITAAGQPLFAETWIEGGEESMFSLPKVMVPDYVPVLFLSIDPTGGSLTSSDFACSLIYVTANLDVVIVGLLKASVNDHRDERRAFNAFIEQVRKDPAFRQSVIVPLIEVNMEVNARHVLTYCIEKLGPWFFPDFGNNQVGPLTTVNVKLDYALTSRCNIESQKVRFASAVLTCNCREKDVQLEFNGSQVLDTLKAQLLGFRFYRTPKTNQITCNGKGGGVRDDLAMTLFIGMNQSLAFVQPGNRHNAEFVTHLQKLTIKSVFPLT